MTAGSLTPQQLAAVTSSASAYAAKHVTELATELLEWEDQDVLRGQRIRELAQILAFAGHDALTLAKSYVRRAALEVVRAQAAAQQPRPPQLTVEEVRKLNANAIFGDDWPSKFWDNVTHLVNVALAAAGPGAAPDQSPQERARQLEGRQHYFGTAAEGGDAAGPAQEIHRG
jgi:hypothetical protein